MKEEFLTELKPGDIFKLNNVGMDLPRIVQGLRVEQVNYFPYTLVTVYYAFADEDSKDRIYQTESHWSTMKKVYKVSI